MPRPSTAPNAYAVTGMVLAFLSVTLTTVIDGAAVGAFAFGLALLGMTVAAVGYIGARSHLRTRDKVMDYIGARNYPRSRDDAAGPTDRAALAALTAADLDELERLGADMTSLRPAPAPPAAPLTRGGFVAAPRSSHVRIDDDMVRVTHTDGSVVEYPLLDDDEVTELHVAEQDGPVDVIVRPGRDRARDRDAEGLAEMVARVDERGFRRPPRRRL